MHFDSHVLFDYYEKQKKNLLDAKVASKVIPAIPVCYLAKKKDKRRAREEEDNVERRRIELQMNFSCQIKGSLPLLLVRGRRRKKSCSHKV